MFVHIAFCIFQRPMLIVSLERDGKSNHLWNERSTFCAPSCARLDGTADSSVTDFACSPFHLGRKGTKVNHFPVKVAQRLCEQRTGMHHKRCSETGSPMLLVLCRSSSKACARYREYAQLAETSTNFRNDQRSIRKLISVPSERPGPGELATLERDTDHVKQRFLAVFYVQPCVKRWCDSL